MAEVDSKRKFPCQETKCRSVENTSDISDDEEILFYYGLKIKISVTRRGK